LSFTNLTLDSIETHVPDDSIVIWDKNIPRNELVYIVLSNITSISRTGKLLIVDDSTLGRLFLDFETEYYAQQADSLLNYVLNNSGVIIQNLDPKTDDIDPIIYFYSNVGNTASGATISVSGTSSTPVNTSMGLTFSTSIVFGTQSSITKNQLIDQLIDYVEDNRDGILSITGSNVLLYDYNDILATSVLTSSVTYSLKFVVSDIAGNEVDTSSVVNIYII
jgi:hypothetical protein